MKQQLTDLTQLSSHIATKANLSFRTASFRELADFIEEILPAIDAKFVRGKTSFEDFWRYYEDDSPIPFAQLTAKKETLRLLLSEIRLKDDAGEIVFYDENDGEFSSLDEIGTETVTADYCLGKDVFGLFGTLEALKAFTARHGCALTLRVYNLYPYCEYWDARLNGKSDLVWTVEQGEIAGGGEIDIFDEGEGEWLLLEPWWLSTIFDSLEEAQRYGVSFYLEIGENAGPWKLLDCGRTAGLRLKYGEEQ